MLLRLSGWGATRRRGAREAPSGLHYEVVTCHIRSALRFSAGWQATRTVRASNIPLPLKRARAAVSFYILYFRLAGLLPPGRAFLKISDFLIRLSESIFKKLKELETIRRLRAVRLGVPRRVPPPGGSRARRFPSIICLVSSRPDASAPAEHIQKIKSEISELSENLNETGLPGSPHS